jgi:DNA-binding transcriptional LysR family regulator
MRMDFPRLAVFRAVARHLSFSRAADELNMSQPAVSRHLRLLEAELGVRLFQRLGNRVELTDAGRILADYAQRVSVLTEEVRRVLGELEGLRRGYLRIGASSTPGLYLLPDVLARFQKKYPDIEITLVVTNSGDVTQRVLAGEFDLGFVGAPPDTPGVQTQPFADDEIVLIVPAGHALAQPQSFAPNLLAGETLIARETGSATQQIAGINLARLGLTPACAGNDGVRSREAHRRRRAGRGLRFATRDCARSLAAARTPAGCTGVALSASVVRLDSQRCPAPGGGAGISGAAGQRENLSALATCAPGS